MPNSHSRRCSAHVFVGTRDEPIRERCEQPSWHDGAHMATRVVQALTPEGNAYETLATFRWLAKPVVLEASDGG